MGRAPLQLLIQEDTHTHTHEAGGVGLSPHFQLSQLHHIVTELARWALKSPRALSVFSSPPSLPSLLRLPRRGVGPRPWAS